MVVQKTIPQYRDQLYYVNQRQSHSTRKATNSTHFQCLEGVLLLQGLLERGGGLCYDFAHFEFSALFPQKQSQLVSKAVGQSSLNLLISYMLELNFNNSPMKLFKLKNYLIIAPMLGGIQIQNVKNH